MDVGLQRVLWLLIALACVHTSNIKAIPTPDAEIIASVPSASSNSTTIRIENNATTLSTTPVTSPYAPTDATSPISAVGVSTNSSTTSTSTTTRTSSKSPPVITESAELTLPSSTTDTPDPITKLQNAIPVRKTLATTIDTTSNPTTTSTSSTTTSQSTVGTTDADAASARVPVSAHADASSRAQSNNTSSDANISSGPVKKQASDAFQEPIKNVTEGNGINLSTHIVGKNQPLNTTSSTTTLAHIPPVKNPADVHVHFPPKAIGQLEKVIAATSSSIDKNLVSNSAYLLHRACTARCVGYLVYIAWLSFVWVCYFAD